MPNPHLQRAIGIGRSVAKPCMTCGKYLLPLVLLIVLASSIFYVRILYGPISLKVLAKPIARSIAAEMPGFGVSIEDALVRLNEEGEVEFRLRNVHLLDEQGSPVAIAPLAALELSMDGLWSARLSPEKVVLIEPRLLLTYSAERGLSFSFARPADAVQAAAPNSGDGSGAEIAPAAGTGPDSSAGPGLPVALRQLDLARVIAEASARARQRSDAASFLRQIGMRNATLVFEYAGAQSVWRVPQADVAVAHKGQRSVFEGSITVASGLRPWTLDFWSEASGATEQVNLKASIRDLVPRAIAEMLPALAPLSALDVPASGEVTLQLTSTGELTGGAFSLNLSQGDLRVPWLQHVPLTIEGGSLDVRYDPGGRALLIEPSTLIWGQSRLTIAGNVVSTLGPDGGEIWAYRLTGVEGRLASEGFNVAPVAIESWVAEGSFRPETGAFTIQQKLAAGGGELRLSGDIEGSQASPRVNLEGQIGNMPLATVQGLWPRAVGADARTWVGESLLGGQVLGGTFKFHSGEGGHGSDPQRLSLAVQMADLLVRPAAGFPPVEIPRALIRLEGSALEITVPESAILLSNGGRIALKAGRFTVTDVTSENPIGQIAFSGEGPASSVLGLIEHEAFGIGRLSNIRSENVEGSVEASLTITLPLRRGITLDQVRLEGRGRLVDGRAPNLIGSHDAQASTIAFEITDKAIDARGDMLLSGVPVKLAWQHIIDAPPEKQPPLRLTSTLDGADRTQLGIDANHLIHGEVPVEVTITRSADEDHRVHVWADLTRADLVLDNVAWRKPPGRSAIMQFDLRPGSRYETELHNFQIVGDDIAISGWMGLDKNERLKEFQFPEFSANVITRLEVKGSLRKDNVWDIVAKGQTYDGRDVFRSLFSVGELGDQPLPERQNAPGLDLKADIATVIGYSDIALRGFTMQLSRRGGKLTALKARGMMDGEKPLEVELQHNANQPRRLVARTEDAGQAFRLVDFYPSLVGGRMQLDVNLDGRGAAEKTGLLRVERFRILGDPVVAEVLQVPDETRPYEQRKQRVVRQAIDFDWMRVPFSVGHGQFVMGDSEIRGPLVGVTMRGKADFRSRQVNIGGTYVPLQGLNSAIGFIPGLGQLLAGPRGEGVLGITFAIQGAMNQPEVLVNPLSLVAPGIFREMFQMTPSQSVTPPRAPQQPSAGTGARSSSAPAAPAPQRRTGAVEPEVLSGWSSETSAGPAPKKK